MGGGCCGKQEVRFDGMSAAYRRALWAVIVINASMFVVEFGAGLFAGSQALKADALDFLADTATYAMTLFVIGMPLVWRTGAALIKGFSLAAVGGTVLGFAAYRALVAEVPQAGVMGGVALLALCANLASVLLLLRFRDGDANVRSVWLCSRNDCIGNLAVIVAAGGVAASGTRWPDLIVAALLAGLFLSSSVAIVRQAAREWRLARALPAR
jgi:Co/Zn/Cd efflux system component